MPSLEREIDERMAAVLYAVERHRFGGDGESPWQLFKVNYFRHFTEEEARTALKAWGKRHGVEVSWREGRTELAGKMYDVVWVRLVKAQ
jgi:hypothetical protein